MADALCCILREMTGSGVHGDSGLHRRWRRRGRARGGANACRRRPRGAGAGSGTADRRAHVLAQQRSDPRRALLQERHAAAAFVPARPAPDVRLLRRAWRAAQAARQARRRAPRRRGRAAASSHGACRRGRPRRPAMAHAGPGARARTQSLLPRRLPVALLRHRRQPRPHARLSGRGGKPWRRASCCARRSPAAK